MNREALKLFVDEILAITPAGVGVFGLAGGRGGEGVSPSAPVVQQLQRAAVSFWKTYQTPGADRALLRSTTDEIQGLLMMVGTLQTISSDKAQHLLNTLDRFMETN